MLPKRLLALTLFAALAVMPACGLHAQWVPTNNNDLVGGRVDALLVNGTNLFAGIFENGVFLSTDNGTSWAAASTGLTGNPLAVYALAVNGSNLFAGIGSSGVYLSTNNGASWTAEATGLYPFVTALAVSGANLFAGTAVGVYLSTDNGTSWTEASTGLTGNGTYVLSLAARGTNLYAGTQGGGVYLSTDNGQSWTASNTGLTNNDLTVPSLVVSGTNLFAGTEGGAFRSTDNGIDWTAASTGLQNDSLSVSSFAVSGTNLFAATEGGVYLSTDNGTVWTAINSGLPTNTQVHTLTVTDTNLFAGTYSSGVWRRPLSDFEISAVSPENPIKYLLTSFPNPFSQSTQITFTSQSAGYAEVSIVNMLGVEVARLFSGELGAGEHSFTWDAQAGSPVPRGTYECLVRMNGQVETLPIVLMH